MQRGGKNAKRRSERKGKKEMGGKNAKKNTRRDRLDNGIPIRAFGGKLPCWDKDTFLTACKDRGYISLVAVANAMSEQLDMTMYQARHIIITGRWRWEYILVMSSYFEFTMREFCDIFLRGFFKETRKGHYVCHCDAPKMLIQEAKKPMSKTKDEKIKEISEILLKGEAKDEE